MVSNGTGNALKGRRAVVTGGTRNIGQSTAMAFAAQGADVAVIGGSDKERLDDTVAALREYGGNATGVLADAAKPEDLVAGFEQVRGELGGVDILVNNLGIRPRGGLEEMTVELWDHVMAVNLRAGFLLCQAAIPAMAEAGWGRVINVSGWDAVAGSAGRVAVTVSKAGVMGLAVALTPEYAARGVTINTIVPGGIDSHRHTPEWYPELDKFRDAVRKRVPMERLGRTEEVASVATFLASDASSFMSAQTLFVAGGYPTLRSFSAAVADASA